VPATAGVLITAGGACKRRHTIKIGDANKKQEQQGGSRDAGNGGDYINPNSIRVLTTMGHGPDHEVSRKAGT
jgi:hypothetical protein